jgi:hypothetical protein
MNVIKTQIKTTIRSVRGDDEDIAMARYEGSELFFAKEKSALAVAAAKNMQSDPHIKRK